MHYVRVKKPVCLFEMLSMIVKYDRSYTKWTVQLKIGWLQISHHQMPLYTISKMQDHLLVELDLNLMHTHKTVQCMGMPNIVVHLDVMLFKLVVIKLSDGLPVAY